MKTKERLVHFYDLELQTLSLDKKIPNPFAEDMSYMLTILSKLLKRGDEIGANSNIEVCDFDYNKRHSKLILLLNRSDSELSDVAYKDKRTKSRRNGNKTPTEAIEISSHVIITAQSSSNKAEVRMTMGSGIYAERIVKLLNELYEKNKSKDKQIIALKTRPLPTNAIGANNKPITYQVNHRFEYKAHPNAMLADILNTGEVKGLELIENSYHEFDATQKHVISQKTLKLELTSSKTNIQKLRSLFPLAKKNHQFNVDKVRIEYKLGSEEIKRKEFAVNDLDAAFTKSEKIELDTDHNQQQTEIGYGIIAKMEAIT